MISIFTWKIRSLCNLASRYQSRVSYNISIRNITPSSSMWNNSLSFLNVSDHKIYSKFTHSEIYNPIISDLKIDQQDILVHRAITFIMQTVFLVNTAMWAKVFYLVIKIQIFKESFGVVSIPVSQKSHSFVSVVTFICQ